MNKKTTFLIILLGAIFSSCFQQYDKDDTYREGWSLEWEDNFDKQLDQTAWSKISRDKQHNYRYMSDSSALYIIEDGNLLLKGIVNPSDEKDLPFLTGGIIREGVKANEAKRIEARVRINAKVGASAYISLVPDTGEDNILIDIIDQYGNDKFVYQSVTSEYTTTQGMPDNPPSSALVGVNPLEYHIYGVEKYPDSIVFFVDGTRTKKYPRIPTEIPGQFPFDDLDMDLYIGLRLNHDTDPSALPAEVHIDWVRYYAPETEEVTSK